MRIFVIGLCVFVVAFTLLVSVGFVVSQSVEIERFDFSTSSPVAIAVVGDLHYPNSFLTLGETASLLEEISPDVVVFTGDILDASGKERDIEALGTFFSRLTERFLCFATIGNHEIGSDLMEEYVDTATRSGVNILLNDSLTRRVNGREIAFIGLSDGYSYEEKTLHRLPAAQTKVLITHRPEKLEEYASSPLSIKPDYVFAGHAHGGIARLGKLALYAPNQGLFPHYTSGLYEKDTVRMVVTRGLGVSSVDFRCFNKYHLPVIEI